MSKGRAETNFRAKAPWIMALLRNELPIGHDDAAAILGNLGHESGGLMALQEISPTVQGSKGGYGWAQWTGPRRRKFMAWCQRNKLKPASDEANFGYLLAELRGPYKGAIAAVKRAGGLAAKVKAFELQYEGAGVKHYASRNQWAAIALEAYLANPNPTLPGWALPAGARAAVAAVPARPTLPRAPAPAPAGRDKQIVPVPVDVPGLDKPLAKSSTVWAAIAGFGATGLATAQSFIDSLTGIDWRVVLVMVLALAATAAVWIIMERRKYADAHRAIKAGIEQIAAAQADADAG